VDVDTIIESIFSTTGDARLPQPVPLSQMIDLLVDFWEVRLGIRERSSKDTRIHSFVYRSGFFNHLSQLKADGLYD